jgi:hypothetical protein
MRRTTASKDEYASGPRKGPAGRGELPVEEDGETSMTLWAQIDLDSALITAIIIVPVAALLIFAIIWTHKRSAFLLRQWAEENDLRIVAQEERKFFRGPFLWNSSKGQMVYYVTVEEGDGNLKSGFVRLGSWALGIFSDQVAVKWD